MRPRTFISLQLGGHIKGRLWPLGYPFGTCSKDGQVLEADGFRFAARPGDFQFYDIEGGSTHDPEKVDRMGFNCPINGRRCGPIVVDKNKPWSDPPEEQLFRWNGNVEKPWLKEYIDCSNCGCRFWIKDGCFSDA